MQNKHKEACEYFKKAYEIEAQDNYLVALALSEVKSNQIEEAIKHYKTLVTHYPSKPNFQYNLACCCVRLPSMTQVRSDESNNFLDHRRIG